MTLWYSKNRVVTGLAESQVRLSRRYHLLKLGPHSTQVFEKEQSKQYPTRDENQSGKNVIPTAGSCARFVHLVCLGLDPAFRENHTPDAPAVQAPQVRLQLVQFSCAGSYTAKWGRRFYEGGSGVILIPCGKGCARQLSRGRTTNMALSRMAISPIQFDCDSINCLEVIDGIWTSQQSAGPQHVSVCKLHNQADHVQVRRAQLPRLCSKMILLSCQVRAIRRATAWSRRAWGHHELRKAWSQRRRRRRLGVHYPHPGR